MDRNLDYLEVVRVLVRRPIRTDKLYIKLGKRIDPTIRQFAKSSEVDELKELVTKLQLEKYPYAKAAEASVRMQAA